MEEEAAREVTQFLQQSRNRIRGQDVQGHQRRVLQEHKSFKNPLCGRVGSLAEEKIHLLLSLCGRVERVIMGLDPDAMTPAGFCFVEYCDQEGCRRGRDFLRDCVLDGGRLNVDLDPGFSPPRQFSRKRKDWDGRKRARS